MSPSTKDHLPPYRVRPRFQLETAHTAPELIEKITRALAKEKAPCKGQAKDGFVSLYPLEADQHYWSPRLNLTLEEIDSGVLIRGLYGPRPEVWTMFVFFYSLIAFAIVVISVIGYSNISLGHYTGILYAIPVLIMAFLSLYLVAYFGQKLGYDQMLMLHRFLEDLLKEI